MVITRSILICIIINVMNEMKEETKFCDICGFEFSKRYVFWGKYEFYENKNGKKYCWSCMRSKT